MDKLVAEKILKTLNGRTFEEWYDREFQAYVVVEATARSKEEILNDIIKIFHITQEGNLK